MTTVGVDSVDLAVAAGPADDQSDSTEAAEDVSAAAAETETAPPAPAVEAAQAPADSGAGTTAETTAPSMQAAPKAAEPSDLAVASGPAPEAAPAPSAPPAPTQVARAAVPEGAGGEGDYQIWLVSMTDEAQAASFLQTAREKHPAVFGQARGSVARVEFPKGKVFYRVVGTGLSDQGAARSLCDEMRRDEPTAFCKVLAAAN